MIGWVRNGSPELVDGGNVDDLPQVFNLTTYQGNMAALDQPRTVAISSTVARNEGYRLGDTVTANMPRTAPSSGSSPSIPPGPTSLSAPLDLSRMS
jgi:hypothetical protein